MIPFLFRRSGKPAAVRLSLIFIVCAAFLPQALPGQVGEDVFRGVWQVETPDRETLVILLKRNQLASYFRADNADRTVYQGKWRTEEDAARLTWPDGSAHRLVRDDLGFGITALDPSGEVRYHAPVRQIPRERLGQWAKAPESEREDKSARDRAEGFFGIWKIETDSPHYVIIEPDRSAAATWSPREGESRGLRGAWAKHGSELHVAWDSGHYSIFRENPRGFTYQRIPPGTTVETAETEPSAAARVRQANLPPTWLTEYEDEQALSSGGIAFADRKEARKFYRGDWVVPQAKRPFKQIDIGRFGGLSTTGKRSLGGEWMLSGQDLFMRWDNGLRQILSPVGWGFVLYEYQPARPLDGVPTRIYAAAPADAEKLETHLKGRSGVARQMLAMAEAAGIDPKAKNPGWGRTFMRWVWPFGQEEPADETSGDAIREKDAASAPSSDPWWWPFWTERPESSNRKKEEIPVEVDGGTEAEKLRTTQQAASAPRQQEADGVDAKRVPIPSAGRSEAWEWPFE